MEDKPSVTVVGTGTMGSAMAARWADQGFRVTAWNRNVAKAEALRDNGVVVERDLEEAVATADVVVTLLADGPAIEAVMEGVVGRLRPDSIWLQMATVGIESTERLVALAAGAEVVLIDAPVSGTKAPAKEGRLTILASGPDSHRQRVEEVVAAVATRVIWVGGVGMGTRLKLVLNGWLAALVTGLAEAIALAEALGLDPRMFLAAIEGGPLGPEYANIKGSMMVERSYPTSSALYLLTKDIELVAAAGREAGVDLRLPAAIRSLLLAAEADHGAEDMSAVIEALR